MATIPTTPIPAESLEVRFQQLAERWLSETAHVSSTNDLVGHPAFQEIVGLGPAVIPLLLRELERQSGHWHRALRRVTGIDPGVEPGNVAQARTAWLRWGKEQGYQW